MTSTANEPVPAPTPQPFPGYDLTRNAEDFGSAEKASSGDAPITDDFAGVSWPFAELFTEMESKLAEAALTPTTPVEHTFDSVRKYLDLVARSKMPPSSSEVSNPSLAYGGRTQGEVA